MRHPARKGLADSNQKPILEAIEMLVHPLPVMVLSAAGNGVEDLLVPITFNAMPMEGWGHTHRVKGWLLVECKVPRYQLTASTAVRYTKAQIEWRKATAGWPRITVTSAQDAVDKIRWMTR